jgi:hypothetical protein
LLFQYFRNECLSWELPIFESLKVFDLNLAWVCFIKMNLWKILIYSEVYSSFQLLIGSIYAIYVVETENYKPVFFNSARNCKWNKDYILQ